MSSWPDQLPYKPASPKHPASPVLQGLLCVFWTGLEVSLRNLFQDSVIQGKIGNQLPQPSVLFLQLFELLSLLYTHATILSPPAIVGLFGDADLSAGFTNGSPLDNQDPNLTKLVDDLLWSVYFSGQ